MGENVVDVDAIRARFRKVSGIVSEEMRDDQLALCDEVERLREQGKQAQETDRLEIRHGWLVESGYEPNFVPGYGYEPDTDAAPILELSKLPGWPGAELDRLRAVIAEVEKLHTPSEPVRDTVDDPWYSLCRCCHERMPCSTRRALGVES